MQRAIKQFNIENNLTLSRIIPIHRLNTMSCMSIGNAEGEILFSPYIIISAIIFSKRRVLKNIRPEFRNDVNRQ